MSLANPAYGNGPQLRSGGPSGYAKDVSKLLGCPFCRELFLHDGERGDCEQCHGTVRLVPIERMPPSIETQEEQAAVWEATPPEDRTLPWLYWRRGRGALFVCAVVGLVCFFLPWFEVSKPDTRSYSGFEIAQRLFWVWGGAAAWATLIPLVVVRRTLMQMRGVRVIACLFTSMSAVEIALLAWKTPTSNGRLPVEVDFSWGLFLSFAVACIGTVAAARFGGRIDDVPSDLGLPRGQRSSSQGYTLH